MKTFKKVHEIFGTEEVFTEETAPEWLTCANTIKGSTADGRWFWNEHVLTLSIGFSVYTDFHKITRIS